MTRSLALHKVVSSLHLFLYRDDCRSVQPDCHIVKSADETVVLCLLSSHTRYHRSALQEFAEWCGCSCLELSINKTREMIMTFSPKQRQVAEVSQHHHTAGGPVDIVNEYKSLGTIFDNLLRFSCKRRHFKEVPSETAPTQEVEIILD